MQTRPAYPHDAVTGGCFISGDYSTDEPIIDLDIYIDALPPFGRLCISAKAVRMLMNQLGLEPMTDQTAQALIDTGIELDRLAAENRQLRTSLVRIIEIGELCKVVRVAELAGEFPELEPVP